MQIDTIKLRGLVVALMFSASMVLPADATARAVGDPEPTKTGGPVAATDSRMLDSAPAANATSVLPAQLQDFDAYVEDVRKQFDVPAIAVAIVKDGEVVLERGYGMRELDGKMPVDEHTMFAIASNTKAFTAASLSILSDEGKLDMGDRVIEHLPWFRMSDAYVTNEMRIRDLLAHRSGLGLGAGDLLYWPGTDHSTEQVARRLKDVPLDGGFRAQYAYDNILFGVAQLVVEAASGKTYEEFLRTRIFKPLGMDETRFNSDFLEPGDNVATGYSKADFTTLVEAPKLSWGNVSGAGGLYSSVHDLTKWVRVQLDQGVIAPADGAGKSDQEPARLFSEKRQQEMWSVLTPIKVREPSVPELAAAMPNFMGYGEGWSLSDYRGEKLAWHTGGWPGYVSRITMVPEQELGIIVLTSAEAGGAFQAVTMRALDAYLGAPKTDWTAAYIAAQGSSKDKAAKDWQAHLDARDAKSRPSLPLADYADTYRDPWYGDVVVSEDDGKLRIRFAHTPALAGSLEPWQNDTFVVRWDQRWLNADSFLTFALDPDGEVREVRMEAISPATDFSFDFHHLRLTPVEDDKQASN